MKSFPPLTTDKVLSICLIMSALVVCTCATGYGEAPIKVSTVDGLIELYDSASCKECHEKIYGQWEKSHHARSLMGINDEPLLAALMKRLGKKGLTLEQVVTKDLPCFTCHLPQAKYATDAVAQQIARASVKKDKEKVRKLNIGCLVCHGEKAVVHGRAENGVVYGSKDIADHEGHPVKKSPLLKNSLLCGQCHGLGPVLNSPHMPVQCATLYGSYLHAYIPSGGTKTCQQCHMKDNDHYMPPNFNNPDELSARLREALPMEVQSLAYTFHPNEGQFFPLLVVKTRITSRAGHRIPDG